MPLHKQTYFCSRRRLSGLLCKHSSPGHQEGAHLTGFRYQMQITKVFVTKAGCTWVHLALLHKLKVCSLMCTSKRFASCSVFRTSLLAPGLRQASTGSSLRFAHNASTHLIQQVLLTSYEPMQNTSVFATKARCKARCIWMHLDIPSPSPKCVIPWEPQVFFVACQLI